MRIIAGDRRGTRLEALPGDETRPTLERVKEAVFSSVQFVLPGAQVLDLYAGSGQMGLEALSRGAGGCVFVDHSRDAAAIIKQNCKKAALYEKSRVVTMEADAFLAQAHEQFDIVLLDPPYRKGLFPRLLEQIAAVTAPGGQVICEGERDLAFPQQAGVLVLQKVYRYGTVQVARYLHPRADSLPD